MSKIKKLSLTDLVLYGLVFMVPIARVSLYGVVYNLSHGMVALVYIIGAIAMFFTAPQLFNIIKAHLILRVGLYLCRRVHQPRCGFSHRMDFVAGLSVIPYAGCRPGRCCCSCNTSANTDLGMAVNLCGYRNGHKLFGNTTNG
ncbi:Uncharacterised protein [Citrobacter freundii]|nr:Uncharacterised protein [Citrobacter freundii]